MFPIKYIDNNLVWNKDNEVFAYYELIPYNYSFLSAEQKFIVHDSFRQLIAQSREGKIHALQIATESSIRSMQEQSKKLVTGKLKEVACQKIDEQTEALVSMIGDNQVDYRFFLGFKLMVTEEQLNLKNIKKSAWLTFKEFLHEVNHTLMNDFVSMPNDEINRYMKMEKLLENKISRRFKVRRLEIHDFGYLMEHLYGRDGIAYEDYEYQLPKKKLQKETLIKYYDLIRPTRCVIEESQRYLRLEHEDKESYVSYFTVNAIVGELDFPSSEIFYFQQQQFTFPVDTSMNVEIVENRKALTTVRNKKKELKDLDNHAYQAGSETSSNVVDALDSVDELETDLDQTKESMYKLSYVIRVSAPDLDELKRRCDEVKDFYDDLNVKLVRPAGDMLGLHSEFLPASKRYINDYVQYVKSDFLAGLGFGATQQLGETTGIYMGYSVDTGRNVYLQPSLASHGVKLPLGRGDEVVVKFVLHQVDRTAAEAAAHDARTRHAARLGNFGQEVQFLARHFVILRHAPVGFVHPLADRFVVTLFERIADIEHTLLLADHVAGTLVVLVRDLILDGIELLHRSAAQELLPEHLGHPLARSPAVVVGRTHQLVLHARIEQDEFVTLGVEREIGILQRTAVQTDQVALLAEHRGELVHDAAVHAAVVVLGRLTDLRQFELVDTAVIEVVQRKGIG